MFNFHFHRIKNFTISYHILLLSHQFFAVKLQLSHLKCEKIILIIVVVLSANIHGEKPDKNIQLFRFSSDVYD